jgi:hypothetical protein
MLLLIILLIPFVCSIILPNVRPNALGNVIPEEIITNNMSPYIGFDEAMRTKNAFGWTDDQLVRQFSKQEPEKVEDFIFRELDNPAIDDARRLRHLDMLANENPGFKLSDAHMFQVGRTGHEELVYHLIVRQPELGLVAAYASKFGDQLHVFQIAIGLERSPATIMAMLNLAAEHSIPFIESGLHKISTLPLQMSQMFPGTWYNQLVSHYLGNGRSPDILEYLLTRPEWNPGSIENLLMMMHWGIINRNNDFTTRLGREFLNPRLTFRGADGIQIIGGTQTLDAAILKADADPNYFIFDLDVVLRSIRDGDPT